MINVKIICIGESRERYFRDACGEYIKMSSGEMSISMCEISAERLPSSPSPAQIASALSKEAAKASAQIPPRAYTIALCVEGERLSTDGFISLLNNVCLEGTGSFCFIIGSSYGIDGELKRRCRFRLSLSEMTFAHRLASVMLCEQLYRAASFRAGKKYGK